MNLRDRCDRYSYEFVFRYLFEIKLITYVIKVAQIQREFTALGSPPITEEFATPEDVAALVSYLASKESKYMTGKMLMILVLYSKFLTSEILIGQCVSLTAFLRARAKLYVCRSISMEVIIWSEGL